MLPLFPRGSLRLVLLFVYNDIKIIGISVQTVRLSSPFLEYIFFI